MTPKIELAAQTAAATASGGAVAIGATLAQFGTTPALVVMAFLGSLVAVAELEPPRRWRRIAALIVFNVIVGAVGAPFVFEWRGIESHAGVVLGAFLFGWVGHSALTLVRKSVLPRLIEKAGK